ncbi:MAG TPA: hypothetical protein VM692_08815 [Gammaproteobacteria bacterium]|nr:hypothetical protein [Gammaproteobacteria bacterium]
MDRRIRYLAAAAALAAPLLIAEMLAAQPGEAAWTAARTQAGQPDLQGHWTNDTYTPLERPAELGDKQVFTPEEAAAFLRSRVDDLNGQAADDVHYDDAIWQAENYDKVAHLHTSLVLEPHNGRLPKLTAHGEDRLPRQRAMQRATSADSAQSRSLAERCISWGNVGPPMVPPTYNANLQILQSRDIVVIRHEMMHDVRTVYLEGRAHPPAELQWLAGHSIGRFEGDTLVVDTTNFTPLTNFRGSPQNTRQDIFASEHLHVVERFTRTSDDNIHYEFTVDDPETWVEPWSGEMEIRRTEGPIYEYACHEGNLGLANILRAARVAERQATRQ